MDILNPGEWFGWQSLDPSCTLDDLITEGCAVFQRTYGVAPVQVRIHASLTYDGKGLAVQTSGSPVVPHPSLIWLSVAFDPAPAAECSGSLVSDGVDAA